MSVTTVIGVDPGGVTGIARLTWYGNNPGTPHLIQASPDAVHPIVDMLLEDAEELRLLLALERFVVGPRAAKSAKAKAGEVTRRLIGQLYDLGTAHDVRVMARSASEVKPWATDNRLARLGLGLTANGMPHARDAARHAAYAAVADLGIPDPLSRRAAS